jgi:hypothetical protein
MQSFQVSQISQKAIQYKVRNLGYRYLATKMLTLCFTALLVLGGRRVKFDLARSLQGLLNLYHDLYTSELHMVLELHMGLQLDQYFQAAFEFHMELMMLSARLASVR